MKKYIFLSLIFTFFFLNTSFGFQLPNGDQIKIKLQNDLKTQYLKKLEEKFGDCGSSPESCLSKKDDYMIANLKKNEVCFPYTMCGFYHCMENTYHCNDVGINYFTDLAFPTCSAYEANIKKGNFSDRGVEWIYSVMVCLQKGLVDECFINGNCQATSDTQMQKKTCHHITEFTLAYHPGCYINSGVGVCHLPLKDKLNIWKTVNPYMTKRERQEAYKVIFECITPGHK